MKQMTLWMMAAILTIGGTVSGFGQIVVLDFWGSWCGWCIKGFPEMKKYYEKYKDRMEILGMDLSLIHI